PLHFPLLLLLLLSGPAADLRLCDRVCSTGLHMYCWAVVRRRGETLQPAKPSFLEYFEQKEREANEGGGGGGDADNRKPPPEGDLEVMRSWSVEELRSRLASLEPQMEQEIEEIRQRYQAKKQPILDAIQAKKKHPQHAF
ncbi:hypothetical protein CRUP_012706, partial [Coryphaenoides rupestris]